MNGSPIHLLTDKKGVLWIGSKNGLACFDGVRFKTFTEEDGLAGNFVTDIEMDRTGTIYVASGHGGISRYTGGMKPFEKLPDLEDVSFVTCILPLNADTIFFGSLRYCGLHSWIRGKVDSPYPNIGNSSPITDLLLAKDGSLYVAQRDSVQVLHNGKTTGIAITPNIKLWSTLEMAPDGEVWCGAGKAYHLKGSRKTDSIPLPPGNPAFLDRLLPLNDGVLLAGNTSLWKLDHGRWISLPGPDLFPQNIMKISSAGKMLWACGAFGLVRIHFPKGISRLPASKCYTFTSNKGRRLAGIITHPDPKDEQIRRQLAPVLREVYHSRNGRIWYLTGKGIYWQENGRLKYYVPPPADESSGLSFNTAFEDQQGRIWFGTDRGVLYYDGHSFVTPPYPVEIDKRDLRITSIGPGGNDQVVAGSNEYIFLLKDKQAFPNQYNLGLKSPLDSWGIVANSSGELWTNVHNMICRIHTYNNGKLRLSDTLRLSDFPGRSIVPEGIAFDREDNLWILTGGSLVAFPHHSGKTAYLPDSKFIFSPNDFPDLFTGQARKQLYTDSAGQLLIVHADTAYRLNAVDIIARVRMQAPPQLSLTGISQNGHPTDWKRYGYTTTDGIPSNPVFCDSIQAIRFDYAATAPLNAEYITYHYRLVGYEQAWNDNGRATTITYAGLPAGNYTLEIKAHDNSGHWSNVVSYPFDVLPPWWRTWWAYLAYVIIALTVIASIFHFRLRALRRKDALQQLIGEQQMKAFRAQINPHFLQNTFDFMAQSLLSHQPDQTLRVITQISSFMRNVLYRSDEVVINLEQEMDFAEEYLAINRLLFHNSFEYTITIAPDADITDITVPSMLLQPLLENAIAHGVSRTETGGLITVGVAVSGDYMVCSITNNSGGRDGRNKTSGHQPKGLKFTEERLAILYRKSPVRPLLRPFSAGDRFTVEVLIPLILKK